MSILDFHPLTPDRWPDLVALFEGHGNPGYCCWRLASAAFRQAGFQEAAVAGQGRRVMRLVVPQSGPHNAEA